MILIIMRHGDAGAYSTPDHARPLTSLGKKQCQSVGAWLAKHLPKWVSLQGSAVSENDIPVPIQIDLALVSPYLRTQQSLRAVGAGLKIANQVTIDAITPMGNAAQSADLVHGYATDSQAPSCMLVVTHMPLVSLLADKICHDFNARIFETADTLIIDYNTQTGMGEQLAFYHADI